MMQIANLLQLEFTLHRAVDLEKNGVSHPRRFASPFLPYKGLSNQQDTARKIFTLPETAGWANCS